MLSPGRLIDTTLELVHVTPVHGVPHTEFTGDPPLHRQPVTSVFVPRLVDATNAHIVASNEVTVEISSKQKIKIMLLKMTLL
jgi:hypothetical protein